jgi:predicted ABC-type transport system involved in lysophospholipase L1 biosynthesis ATPase subunit
MQRVANARARANPPRHLLADEPPGELDEATAAEIGELLARVNADGTAVVVVTHNPALAAGASRRLAMRSGRLVAEDG